MAHHGGETRARDFANFRWPPGAAGAAPGPAHAKWATGAPRTAEDYVLLDTGHMWFNKGKRIKYSTFAESERKNLIPALKHKGLDWKQVRAGRTGRTRAAAQE